MTEPKRARAKELHEKMKNLRVAFRRHWTIYGEIAVEFETKEYFKDYGFTSMKQYLKSLDSACYSTIAEAMAVIKALPELNPKTDLPQYPKENLKILAKLPESQRTKASVLEACRTMKSSDFREHVNTKHHTHIEGNNKFIVSGCDDSHIQVYEGAIARVQEIGEKQYKETISKAESLSIICAAFLQQYAGRKPENIKIKRPQRAAVALGD